jgi:hypothetical protein
MFADDLHDLYKKLNDEISLPAEEVDEIATKLLDAPEDQFVTRKMRLQAIVIHSNFSRAIFDRIFHEFSAETLTSENTNIIHMLITNENATLKTLQTLRRYAANSGTTTWFDTVLQKTAELSDYHLNLSYNGEYIFQDEKVRENLTRTLQLLKTFHAAEATLT